mgnify:CR=1 FL=1
MVKTMFRLVFDLASQTLIIFGIDIDEVGFPIDSVFDNTSNFGGDLEVVGFLGTVVDGEYNFFGRATPCG